MLSLCCCAFGLTAMAQANVSLSVSQTRKQTITGFGAAAMETLMRPIQEASMITKAYGPSSEIGLNILRMEMSANMKGDITAADIGWNTPYDWNGYLTAVRQAKRNGAIILATPWSPPANLKTNNSSSGGKGDEYGNVRGKLSKPDSLFVWMNMFLEYMKSHSAAVDVVSLQNEPDWWVGYSGCLYTPQELHDVVAQYGHLLDKEKYGVKLLCGEPLGFNPEYARLMMEDAGTAKYIDLLGGHVYGDYTCKQNLAKTASYAGGRGVWMTEHLLNNGDNGPRTLPTWHQQMEFVEDVNECLVNGATAYIYWYLASEYSFIGDGTKYNTTATVEGNKRGTVLDRGRLMGQFARQLKGATMLATTSNLKEGSKTPGVNQTFETSAFVKGDSLIVNVIDTTKNAFNLNVTLPCEAAATVHRIQSTEGSVYAEDDVTSEAGKTFTFPIQPRSFTTLIFDISTATAIKGVEAPAAARDNRAYNLQGQPVSNPRHGIYIIGGKKVAIP